MEENNKTAETAAKGHTINITYNFNYYAPVGQSIGSVENITSKTED